MYIHIHVHILLRSLLSLAVFLALLPFLFRIYVLMCSIFYLHNMQQISCMYATLKILYKQKRAYHYDYLSHECCCFTLQWGGPLLVCLMHYHRGVGRGDALGGGAPLIFHLLDP